MYTGKENHPPELENVAVSGNVVLRLASIIPSEQNCKIFFDNWFCSIPLQVALAERKIWSLGTVRQNRLRGSSHESDGDMKKWGRGSINERRCTVNDITYGSVKWYDNRCVHLLSNFVGAEPLQTVKRYDKRKREHNMGKRYYCDYCDRSFIDDLEARKKHLNGSMHVRLKKEHYDYFRDAKTLYKEESAKDGCKRFLNVGECVFGANCRFTHFSKQQLEELRQQIEAEEREKQNAKSVAVPQPPPPGGGDTILSAWLKKQGSSTELGDEQLWKTPLFLQGRTDLPPSLQPITPECFKSSDFEEWG
ncbi:hypothetical protein C0J52_25023 [Blattella germanica]|nr:hypothetical protein C0J52_25023 [Blattella germanica]